MEISGEYRIAADRVAVWEALNDPAMLQKCIPGCQSLERQSDHEYQARIAASIGPVRAAFATRIRLENLNPPESYRLTGESKAGAAGFGRGSADVRLVEEGGATLLCYTADFKVGGKLAQVGSRLVMGATRKTAEDFFGCLARELGGTETAVEPLPPPRGTEPQSPPQAGTGPRPPRKRRLDPARIGWIIALVLASALLAGWILLR